MKATLIYDGECPVCIKAADWIKERSLPGTFEFLSCHSGELAGRFPSVDKKACLEAMHLVLADGTVLSGARAVPEILKRLRRYRWCGSLFRIPGAGVLSGAFYRWFARRRHLASRIFITGSNRR